MTVLLVLGAVLLAVILVVAAVVVIREVNRVTEVEAAPGYSVPEATSFVISRLPERSLRRMRRSEVERLVRFCLGLLERAGVALATRRPEGDELEGEEMVLDVDGVARAMREGTTLDTSDDDLEEVAAGFLEYLAVIGAVGEPAGKEERPPAPPE